MSSAVLIRFVKNNAAFAVKYLFVGGIVYGIEYCIYLILILDLFFTPLNANITAKIIAGFFAYILHRRYTFRKKFCDGLYKDFIKYFLLLLINIPLFGLIFYGVSIIGFDFKITKVFADVFCIVVAYLQTRFWVFGVAKG